MGVYVLWAVIGLPIAGFLVYLTVAGTQSVRSADRCPQCGSKWNRRWMEPSASAAGVYRPHYYCPNGHSSVGTPNVGESAVERLGGWLP